MAHPVRPRRFDYNLAVIGAGAAGLVAAYVAAGSRARVALVERQRMGGDCLNTGCVPSKALINIANTFAAQRQAEALGIICAGVQLDFPRAMARVREAIAAIAPHDSPERYRQLGVDCLQGTARLVSPWTIDIDGREITARAIVIASGATPVIPALPGLEQAPWITSDTVWELEQLPERLTILGGGPIGCELAQCFQRLGAQVTLLQRGPRLLPREDEDVAAFVSARLQRDGVRIITAANATGVARTATGHALQFTQAGVASTVDFDRLLLATGRQPRVSGFGLDTLGVALSATGAVAATPFLRTTVPSIYVCGDVAGRAQFTHAAANQAWHAAFNALFAPFWSLRLDESVLPYVIYTAPELARVGLNEEAARQQGIACRVSRYDLADFDRALIDGGEGFITLLTTPRGDRILGATIIAPRAGEMIAEFALAMRHGLGLRAILRTIHAYPSYGDAGKLAAGVWQRERLTPWLLDALERLHRWRRG